MSSEENVELKINELNISKSFSEKEFQRKMYWDCCSGSKIDKRAVKFFSQLTISLIVIIFSLYQLYRETNTDIYLSLLTMILGIFIDAPRL
tara:strand:+ start:210 stop:482 length:273 start_codon:yes stop_codon:yes gene_type:complete